MGGRLEIERKFAVEPGFALPSLVGAGRDAGVATVGTPETFTQEAVYYDSEDLRLARAKITLRRRTGGTDDGWHLKLPAGTSAREEIHRPLEAGEPDECGVANCAPPADLLDIVFLALRGARVSPVARLVTTRTATRLLDAAGAGLVEIVDDHVHAQTLGEQTVLTQWREVEVELLDAAFSGPGATVAAADGEAAGGRSAAAGKTAVTGKVAVNGKAADGKRVPGGKVAEGKAAPSGKAAPGAKAAVSGKATADGEAADGKTAASGKAAEGKAAPSGKAAASGKTSAGGRAADAKASANGKAAPSGKAVEGKAVEGKAEVRGKAAAGGQPGTDPAGPAGAQLLDAVEAVLRTAGATEAPHGSKLAHLLSLAHTAPPEPAAEPAARPRRPGRSDTAGDVLRAYLAEQVAALLAVDPRVRMDEPDAVHKMRVATRRLRSTLRTFAALFPADLVGHLDVELGDLASALSGARDSEVQLEYFGSRLAALPAELVLGPIEASLSGHLSAGMAVGRDAALAALRDERYLVLLVDLAELARAPVSARARRPAATELPRLVREADRRLARKVATAAATPAGHDRDELLHSARKQAKRLRYAGEALTPIFGADARTLAKLSAEAQELLGTHQDATVAAGLLKSWGVAAQQAGDPTAFTYGLLLGLEELRARTAERDFFDAWPALSAPGHRRWLKV
ncbi:CHAD domain-containing protein [Pseudofrankia sp. DC12]|uniref:CHAD domain-containing protein n=1 Tax=Pseudofrankia sp. DC12 TaxID=683315 RepID=UPI000A590496|nr:CHAD domain-containing protein [Pseudofrankia sp. DC12]